MEGVSARVEARYDASTLVTGSRAGTSEGAGGGGHWSDAIRPSAAV